MKLPDFGHGWNELEVGDVVMSKNTAFLVLDVEGERLRLLELEDGRVSWVVASRLFSLQPSWGEHVIRRRDVA